jgi:hypothetical protein
MSKRSRETEPEPVSKPEPRCTCNVGRDIFCKEHGDSDKK